MSKQSSDYVEFFWPAGGVQLRVSACGKIELDYDRTDPGFNRMTIIAGEKQMDIEVVPTPVFTRDKGEKK